MQKIFTVLSLILLYISTGFAQIDTCAEVGFGILVYDDAGFGLNRPLFFGLDLMATDGLDAQLCESDLPPPPPGNAFDARWWIPPFAGALSSWWDYRAPGDPPAFPFSGTKEHVIKFQSTDFPITIAWDLPTAIDTSSRIKDPFNLQVMSFSGSDSIVITNPAISYVEVYIEYNEILPVGVQPEEDITPTDYKLFQNYPNPFNPTTTIQFQVPNTSEVNIKVFDMIGQEIRTLLNKEIISGVYSVEWDGLNDKGISMSSGIYIYRIVTEEFVQAKEMVLLK